MLRHTFSGVLWAILGYILGVVVCWVLVTSFSSNRHDESVEAVMTAFFAGGPALAIVGFIFGVVRSMRHPSPDRSRG